MRSGSDPLSEKAGSAKVGAADIEAVKATVDAFASLDNQFGGGRARRAGDTHGLAQRYFVQALRLAQAADNVLLAGSVLDAMSHQATFLGRHREAANLARAARTGTAGAATATLTAHFHAMEARALAAGGDTAGADRTEHPLWIAAA